MLKHTYQSAAEIMQRTPDGRAMLAAIECIEEESKRLREAAELGKAIADRWLDSGECDCEVDHICGRPRLERERNKIQSLLDHDA